VEEGRRAAGCRFVAGVDEAGRGPLAGPVVVAAVILPPDLPVPPVADSKALSAAARGELRQALLALPGLRHAVVEVDAAEIDRLNILRATHEGMRRALAELLPDVDFALVDGLRVPNLPVPAEFLVKGDARCAAIAAASILAKERRDDLMRAAARQYPEYGFERHKGYGTAAHLAALRAHGPCPLHRRSFAPVRAALGLAPAASLPEDELPLLEFLSECGTVPTPRAPDAPGRQRKACP
jgi:ribonuclease HII